MYRHNFPDKLAQLALLASQLSKKFIFLYPEGTEPDKKLVAKQRLGEILSIYVLEI